MFSTRSKRGIMDDFFDFLFTVFVGIFLYFLFVGIFLEVEEGQKNVIDGLIFSVNAEREFGVSQLDVFLDEPLGGGTVRDLLLTATSCRNLKTILDLVSSKAGDFFGFKRWEFSADYSDFGCEEYETFKGGVDDVDVQVFRKNIWFKGKKIIVSMAKRRVLTPEEDITYAP